MFVIYASFDVKNYMLKTGIYSFLSFKNTNKLTILQVDYLQSKRSIFATQQQGRFKIFNYWLRSGYFRTI